MAENQKTPPIQPVFRQRTQYAPRATPAPVDEMTTRRTHAIAAARHLARKREEDIAEYLGNNQRATREAAEKKFPVTPTAEKLLADALLEEKRVKGGIPTLQELRGAGFGLIRAGHIIAEAKARNGTP